MSNDQANDRYNPPGIGVEFEQFRFSDISVHELFWLTDNVNSNVNVPYRKINETQGQNVKTREIFIIDSRAHSYQKI
jgi:hypothetical protein